MELTPNAHVLMPEVIKPAIPDDTSLANQCPVWIDFESIEEAFKDVNGTELAHGGELGAATLAVLTNLDTQVKKFIPAYEEWHFAGDMGALERWGGRAKKRRLEVTNRAEAIRKSFKIIKSNFDIEQDRLVEAERLRLEALHRQEALAEKQRQIEAAKAAAEAAQSDEERFELEAYAEEVEDTPIVSVAVSMQQASVGLAQKPTGTTSTPVCWRTVDNMADLYKLFAFLGGEGKHLIGSLVRVEHIERASDKITISFVSLKRDFTTVIPGLEPHRGSEGTNRGR